MLTQRSLWMVQVLSVQELTEVLEQSQAFTKKDVIKVQRRTLSNGYSTRDGVIAKANPTTENVDNLRNIAQQIQLGAHWNRI